MGELFKPTAAHFMANIGLSTTAVDSSVDGFTGGLGDLGNPTCTNELVSGLEMAKERHDAFKTALDSFKAALVQEDRDVKGQLKHICNKSQKCVCYWDKVMKIKKKQGLLFWHI